MKYVALLRGINVGGNNKVDMKQLTKLMESAGFKDVSTYINSGNIFFSSTKTEKQIIKSLESLIAKEFKIDIRVLIRNKSNIDKVAAAIPAKWINDKSMRCDVMFLWEEYNDKSVLDHLTIKPKIDDVKYVPGAIIWKIDRKNATKSGMTKLIGTPVYKKITIRNCNTVRKIQERLADK